MVTLFTPARINKEMRKFEGMLKSVQDAAGGSEEDLAFQVRKV